MIPLVKVGMPDRDKLMPALESVLYSGMIGEGGCVYRFEDAFSEMFRLKHGLAFSSGTAALHASLMLAGVGPGDEVISTSMTAEPTNLSILYVGGVPVFADVDVRSGNISPESIDEKITTKTKAILIVHYAGVPVRMREIIAIAKHHNIPVIEDCAHALGAQYEGRSVGSLGDYSIFSFQAIKHMTTVDGGFLVVRNADEIEKAKRFRWFGLEKGIARDKINIRELGYKYNMHNVAATMGLMQLEVIQAHIKKHQDNGRYFDQQIAKISGLSVPYFDVEANPSYWLYTILSDDSDAIERKLNCIGVQASKLHRPNHLHSIFKQYADYLPNLDEYYQRMIHIPCGWWVSENDRERIVDVLKAG